MCSDSSRFLHARGRRGGAILDFVELRRLFDRLTLTPRLLAVIVWLTWHIWPTTRADLARLLRRGGDPPHMGQ